MKVKHTKLKKSIFLILICISLTTTFVVSASAYDFPNSFIYFCSNSSCSLIDDGDFYDRTSFEFYYVSQDVEYDGVLFPAGSCIVRLVSDIFTGFLSIYHTFSFLGFPSYFTVNDIRYDIDFELFGPSFPGAYYYYSPIIDFPTDSIPTVYIYSSDLPSFTDSVGSGLTSSLSWVGQVFESLTTGPIKPLLECFAVTISVSALLLGIYSIRRFIWGS